ncbi:MAG TPA: alpha/beta fold hydrolase [Microlunatus sp.]
MTAAEPRGLEDEPLVLLPGMNCSARLWSGLDLGPVSTPGLTEPDLPSQVDRLLDELPPRFALAGLSLGAIVAMAMVRTAPNRVTQLALLSTNPYGPTEQQLAGWRRERDRLAAGTTAREIQRDLLPVLLTDDSVWNRPDVVEAALTLAEEIDLDAQLALQATRIDERPGLREIRCPTLVLAAREDRLCPLDRHREISALVPGAELQILERAAHLSPLEQPAAVTAALRGWLAGPPQPRVSRG